MNLLAIDLGSYAVKYAFCSFEKKRMVVHSHGIVVIDEVRKDLPEDTSIEAIQLEITKRFIEEYPDAKIITHVPVELITTRYISLPVNNKKKAEQMIPFQLDENLPYPISEAHYSSYIQKVDDKSEAQVSISPLEGFENLYNQMQVKEMLPHLMASELAYMQAYAEQSPFSGSYAIFDIGHQYTKGYFVHNKNVISNHVSYIAGSVIDEVIAETYEISPSEAITYKHQNCFLLTESQYETVNKDQKEFALLMKQIFAPMVQDMKRWELGFRVKYGRPVDRVFVTGGTSNISNITNFLSLELGLKVEHLPEPHDFIIDEDTIAEAGNLLSSSLVMLASQRSKSSPANMLMGRFSGSATANLPLHSTSFILSRALILLLVISTLIGAEKLFFLNSEEKKLNSKVQKLLKNKSLALTSSDRRLYKRNPERLLKKIKAKTKQVEKEVETIKQALKVNALKPLGEIHSDLSKNDNIHMTLFESVNKSIKTRFESKNSEELATLASILKGLTLKNKKIVHKPGKTHLTMTFDEESK
ncbi:MAG: hypothetical protein CME70_23030 [Halobacteriovorax sp.]|nr:hypothetical protein [Halobacteriovorax sp.]|tara:strand:- start:34158 stop:35747 length:1590 start_codon:yes stop_codon:yes gene_type:complete